MRSFSFAWRGVVALLRSEHNARVHVAAAFLAITSGAVLRLTSSEWLWILLAVGLVWFAEAVNTAIERLADAVTTDFDANIGAAKDVAAAAVLFASVIALFIGLIIFVPHLMRLRF